MSKISEQEGSIAASVMKSSVDTAVKKGFKWVFVVFLLYALTASFGVLRFQILPV